MPHWQQSSLMPTAYSVASTTATSLEWLEPVLVPEPELELEPELEPVPVLVLVLPQRRPEQPLPSVPVPVSAETS